jgi:hypothetical protein
VLVAEPVLVVVVALGDYYKEVLQHQVVSVTLFRLAPVVLVKPLQDAAVQETQVVIAVLLVLIQCLLQLPL